MEWSQLLSWIALAGAVGTAAMGLGSGIREWA